MTKIETSLSEEAQAGLIRDMLERIADELAPQYGGKLSVKRNSYDSGYGGASHFFIDERSFQWFYGVLPIPRWRTIIGDISDSFSFGMSCILYSQNAENVVTEHFKKFGDKYGISKINMKKTFV